MEPVGFLGILKLTKEIVLKNFKHFVCIGLMLVILFVYEIPVIDVPSIVLVVVEASAAHLYTALHQHRLLPPPPTEEPSAGFTFMAMCISSVLFPLLYNPVLAVSVCKAYLNMRPTLKGSLLGIPRSAKNLAITNLCAVIVFLVFTAMLIGSMGILMGLSEVVANPGLLMVVMGPLIGVELVGGVYIATVFSLANTVAILEEKRAWEAMGRSMHIVQGRKWVALGLTCMLYATMTCMQEASAAWRWRGAGMVRGGVQAFIALFGTVSQIVLYMDCKSRLQEPLDSPLVQSTSFHN